MSHSDQPLPRRPQARRRRSTSRSAWTLSRHCLSNAPGLTRRSRCAVANGAPWAHLALAPTHGSLECASRPLLAGRELTTEELLGAALTHSLALFGRNRDAFVASGRGLSVCMAGRWDGVQVLLAVLCLGRCLGVSQHPPWPVGRVQVSGPSFSQVRRVR